MTKLPSRILDRLRSERGIALPAALMVIVVGIGLSGAAIVATISAQRGSVRDQDHKAAIAAADAGISQALFRENQIATTPALSCLVLGPGGGSGPGGLAPGPPQPDGWCPELTGTVGGATYAYRVKPWTLVNRLGQEQRLLTVVSIGTSDEVSRRVAVTALAPTGTDVFGPNGAIGVDWVTLSGVSLTNVSTGSNGTVTVENNATLCGDARYGPGEDLVFENNGIQCPGYGEQEGVLTLPPPDHTAALADNSNFRLFSLDPRTGNASWDPVTRTLTMEGSSTVTLGGGDYVFCRLDMSGSSRLIMAEGSQVRIFFDTPENCGMSSVAEQIKVIGTASITSTAYDPEAGVFDLPGLYVVGSDSIETSAYFSGTQDVLNQFILYAPRTDVVVTGTALYEGAVAGKTLHMDGTAELRAATGFPTPDVRTLILYKPDRYVECTGAAGSPLDANC